MKISIIGSGFSSLAASCYLAKMGYDVTIFEKNTTIGGRARQLKKEGFTFDIGPTWYWMPDVFERFFSDFSKTPSDYYQLEKLNPAYSVYFGIDDYNIRGMFFYQPGTAFKIQNIGDHIYLWTILSQ